MNFGIQFPKLVKGESSSVLETIQQIIDIPQPLKDQHQAYFEPMQHEYNKKQEQLDLDLFGPYGLNLDAFALMGVADNAKPLTLMDCIDIGTIDGVSYVFLYSPYLEQRFLEDLDESVLRVVLDHLQATSQHSSEWVDMEDIEKRWDWGPDIDRDAFDQWKAQREKATLLSNTDTTSNISRPRKM